MSEQRKERCETCRFWESHIDGNEVDGYLGFCRRYPPVFAPQSAIAAWYGESVDVSEPTRLGMFPLTSEGGWCGEYQPTTPDR
jgi:hypothetical protein